MSVEIGFGRPRRVLRTAALALLCAAGVAAYAVPAGAGNNEHTVVPERVYRSAQMSAEELERLIQTKGVRTVISLRGGSERDRWYREETEVCRQNGVQHCGLGFSATHMPRAEQLQKLLDTFDHAAYPVLIHCRAGSDRTGMAAAVYLACYQGVPVDQARHRELSLRYGHVAIGPAGAMDRFFKLYRKTSGGADLRTWIETRYPELQGKSRGEDGTAACPADGDPVAVPAVETGS